MALNQFQSQFSAEILDADLYYLDLLSFRSISNAIAQRFGVHHQSPQVLIIKNGLIIAHESHGAIGSINFEKYS